MKYGILTAPGRFITWCDNKWYETTNIDTRPFSLDEALQCIKQLVEHFQYHVTLISDDGIQEYEFGKPVTKNVTSSIFDCPVDDGDFSLL